jgi:hypothetical protein
MKDATALLEEELALLESKDRECRRLNRAIRAETAAIEDLNHRTALEMARLRTSREGLRSQHRTRIKWLKSVAADNVRERLGIDAIPGYQSPLDQLLQRRLDRRAERVASKNKVPPTANDSAHPSS